MVLHRRHNPELLHVRSVRPKLAVSLLQPVSTSLADYNPDPSLLRRHMDRDPLHILPPVQKPLLGAADFRHGPWCASLGSDPLEHVYHGQLPTLDSRPDRQWIGRAVIVAVAGSIGCGTRRR